MKRDVVITGVGAVTPLGVGARTLHERWTRGPVRDRGRPRALRRVRCPRAPVGEGGAALGPLHAARAHGRAARRWPTPAGTRSRPGLGPLRVHHRHRDRRHHHDRGAAHDHGGARAGQVSPLGIPILMANAASGVMAMKLRAARAVVRHRVRLRAGRARDRDRRAADRLRRRRPGGRGRHRVHPHAAHARRLLEDGGAFQARHLATVRPAPRRLRPRRGRGRAGAGGRSTARERGARVLGRCGLRLDLRRLPPDRARARRAAAPPGPYRLALEDAGVSPADVAYVEPTARPRR